MLYWIRNTRKKSQYAGSKSEQDILRLSYRSSLILGIQKISEHQILNTNLLASLPPHRLRFETMVVTWYHHNTDILHITKDNPSLFPTTKPLQNLHLPIILPFHTLLLQWHSEHTPTWLLLLLSSQGHTFPHPSSPNSALFREHGVSSSSHTPNTGTSKSCHLSPSMQCTPHIAPTPLPHPPKLSPATTPSPSSTRGFAASTARKRFSERWWTQRKRGSTCGWWRSSSRRGCRSWRAKGREKMGSSATGSTLTRSVLGTMLCTRKWGLGGLLGYGLILLRILHRPLSMFSSSMLTAWQNYLSTRLPKCSTDIVCEFSYAAYFFVICWIKCGGGDAELQIGWTFH